MCADQAVPNEQIALKLANHAGIAVSDLDRSIAFYSALTGENPSLIESAGGRGLAQSAGVDEDIRLRYATFHLRNLNIDVIEYQQPRPAPARAEVNQPGSMHLCFEVDDLDAVYDRMRKAGIEFAGKPYTFDPNEGFKAGAETEVVYFDDPDGTHLELIAPRGPFARDRAG